MTKVPQGFDFSFLNDEEARKILQVLERNEELQRAEKDRISKLQKTKRDIRWLQGVTGEWFEEIQRKKFCNETDVSQMLKQPLTYRLKKGMAENDPMELQTSQSKTTPTQRNPTPVPSRLSFRSSFASLFSFGKPRKETLKPHWLGPKGCDRHVRPAVSVRGTAVAKLYNSPLQNQPVESAFVPKPAGMREGSAVPLWDASMLEREFFRVLDDLDSTLAQEQSPGSVNTRSPLNYGSRTQFSHFHSGGNRHGNATGRHKNHYNETSNMSIYDILRPGTPREGFKTFSSRTRTIYDMYRTREPRFLKEDYVQKNTFGSSSLCFDSRRIASPATGHFTARSIHFPATTQNKNGFIPPSHQQSPKRTPLSSIIWNRSDSSGDRSTQEEFLRAPSPMEVDPADQVYPRCFQENRTYEFYHSQSAYQSVSFNSPRDSTVSRDPFENSENMPFYHQDNPFARSFFSNTFGRNREQRFGRSSFWGQQGEHSSWSGIHQSRKPFTSDRDFEMISTEANSASSSHGHNVSSQYWGSISPNYRTTIPRDQEEPHPLQFDSQTSTVESMEVSQGNGNLMTHFGTANICSTTGSSCHIKSGSLECQQDSSPKEVPINQEPYSFGTAQTLASSFKTSFPQIPDDKRNHQRPKFQNPTVTLQKIKPVSLPIRSYTEATVTNSNALNSPPPTQSQPSILLAEVNNEKDLSESILEKGKQLNKMDQTNMTSEMPQPVSETLADFQSPLSQDSGKTNRFVFNASTTIISKRSPKVISRKDSSKIHISQRDKANELKKDMGYTEKQKSGLATSFPFIQESRTASSFPSPNQSCHQELIVSTEDKLSTIENNLWSSEPTGNQNAQSPEKSANLDTKGEQCTKTHSTKCSKSTAGLNIPCDSVGLSSGALPDPSPSNDFSLGSLVAPSTEVFSRKTLSGQHPFLGEREKEDNNSQYQNNQFTSSPSKTVKSDDSCVCINNEVVDVKCHLHPPFRAGKGKAKIRRRTSDIEKLSKTESESTPTSGSSSLIQVDQSDSKAPEPHTIYCTLPRKSASFLANSRKSESKTTALSFRNAPLPLQLEYNLEDPIGKDASNIFNSNSSESESRCSKVVSDSASVTPEATENMTTMTNIGSASIRKGPFPFLTKRAVSWPSEVPHASFGRDEREECSVSDMDASAITLRPWEKTINPLESDSPVRDCSLTKRYHQKDPFQECTEKDGKNAASKTFSISDEDSLPFSSDMSGGKSGKTLHKFKTTSMFSVFGDEDNVKCLEVVSVYYTLPRKHSKKLCNLLQKHTQNTDEPPESTKVGTVTFSSTLEKEKLNYSTQEQSGTPSSGHLKMLVSSAQENSSCRSPNTEKVTVLQLSSTSPSEPTLQERASIGADVSFHKGESKTREISPDNLTKTPLGDSQNRKKRGKKLQSKTLHTSLILQERKVTEEKSENCQHSIKSPDSGPSPPAHAEGIAENHQTRSSGECAGSGIATTAIGSAKCLQKEITGTAEDDSSNGLQHQRRVRRADFQKKADNALSGSESQVFALTPALPKLHLDEETCSGKQDLDSLQSKPGELPQRSQEVNLTKKGKTKDEMQRLAWDQPLLPEGSNKNKTSLDDLEKGKNRSSPKHRLASRKFPAKDLSPRRHVATIFPQSGNSSGFSGLSFGTPECNILSSEPTPKSTESTDENRLNNEGMDVKKSKNLLLVTVMSDREAAIHLSSQKSNGFSQPHQNEFKNSSESPPNYENSKDVTVAQIVGRESGTLSQPTVTSLGETDFSDHQRRRNPHLPVEPTEKSAISTLLSHCQQQQRHTAPLEWEPEPHPYRSKSLKSINMHGDLLRKSHPPKTRERHFSESTSIDNALSHLTLGGEFSNNNGYSRKFKSSSELPSYDENENWALYSNRIKMGPKSATSISRPLDYGIFGKEQQLAFLENVKRSLTQGRLWKPSFLKNPGFLKDEVIHPPNPMESLSSDSPSNQMPEDGLSPHVPLNIYEGDPADSDCDTDTTTDDEYYLDEHDKESEL
ncbi:exophilin-5 isoform X1 [Phyllostomus hastatus]|uniref:exophilin-5 isoform X1 n=3 Tax=Phyllostomus hastatus TaxID=9423 RepID=UPI001E6813B1|nr:exophilin-5 isoform X1 [Phyllostomus hastatus]